MFSGEFEGTPYERIAAKIARAHGQDLAVAETALDRSTQIRSRRFESSGAVRSARCTGHERGVRN